MNDESSQRVAADAALAAMVSRIEARPVEELLTMDRVLGMIGICRANLYARLAAGEFPKPIPLGRRRLWVLSEIQAWIKDRISEHRTNGHQAGTAI